MRKLFFITKGNRRLALVQVTEKVYNLYSVEKTAASPADEDWASAQLLANITQPIADAERKPDMSGLSVTPATDAQLARPAIAALLARSTCADLVAWKPCLGWKR